jgi:hypothetical protein
MSGDGCTPYFEVYKCQGLNITRLFTFPAVREYKSKEKSVIFLLSE